MTFKPGTSGNPSGKPAGARNKTTLAVEALLDGEAEYLTRKAIELAKAGDMAALRLCLDRIVPARKDRHVASVALPVGCCFGCLPCRCCDQRVGDEGIKHESTG